MTIFAACLLHKDDSVFPRKRIKPAFSFWILLVFYLSGLGARATAKELADLWSERVKTVVAVEFYVETEIERRPCTAFGTVIDREGTIILPPSAITSRTPPAQLKDFRVYRVGQPATQYVSAQYLGPDAVTGWHFIRAAASIAKDLTPITEFANPLASAEPRITDEVWGIGLRNKDEDFAPYFMTGRVAFIETLPQRTAVGLANVAAPNLPVFDRDGFFVGLGVEGFGESYTQYSHSERGTPLLLMSVDEVRVFRLASEVLPFLKRIPRNPLGRPLAWLGTYGLQPIDPEVAKFLKLENRAAFVVSEVLEGSPAEKAGLQERDIVVAMNGAPLPMLKPERAIAGWFDREIARHAPADTLQLTVLRGAEQKELSVTLADEPKLTREADRKYFDRLGFSVREFVFNDAVARRLKQNERTGVIAHLVKNNSAVSSAGLRGDDWIREIDGAEIKTFAEAVEKLTAIEADRARAECVLLISRGGETKVLRVKLK